MVDISLYIHLATRGAGWEIRIMSADQKSPIVELGQIGLLLSRNQPESDDRPAMVDKLVGHWKLENTDNLEEYMKAMKVNIILRKVAKTLTSYEEISKDDDTWVLHITSTFKSAKVVFKIGEPFKDTTLDGRTVMTTFTIDGDLLIETQEPLNKSDAAARFERQVLEDGRMCVTCIATEQNVVAKRYHQPYTP